MDPEKCDRFAISHGDCIDDAQFVADEVCRRFGLKDYTISYVGPVIGAHSGPGTVALFFYAKHK
ncbi:DegV family protein [Anaerotruncus massiliensis (ex Liu et al. 2021)]